MCLVYNEHMQPAVLELVCTTSSSVVEAFTVDPARLGLHCCREYT